ncbi:unnamed protein product [Arabidopsis lyrata]|nr:unnamed protein product [Arabidopsis lyrata]
MYHLPTSCLVLFFLAFLFHHLPCASSKKELGGCETLFQCGNVTAGFPFSGQNRHKLCGHPFLELYCVNNITTLFISNKEFHVLKINQTSNTITLARFDLLGSFCSSTFTNVTLPPEVFEISPTYKSVTVFHLCDPWFPYHSSYKCPEIGLISMSENLEHNNNCRESFTVNLPTSFVPEEGVLNLTRLESALREGFELMIFASSVVNHLAAAIKEISCTLSGYLAEKNVATPTLCSNATQVSQSLASPLRNVSIPASRSALNTMERTPTLDNLKKALEEGFKLGLNKDCSMCIESGGSCGYNQVSRRCLSKTLDDLKQQNLKALIPLKHYSYAQVKRITKSLAEVVGKGGFGTVYKGTLCDGRSVAVKMLKYTKGNGEEFINEVASMSKTSHVNIVSLLGFCSECSKRAILYEYLENGSLDRFISRKSSLILEWTTLYSIALGIARDFGLAKLCKKKESNLSLRDTRGTIGYIAPEVFSRMYGRVSHKSDVFSYGMLVLEMIGARNNERLDQNSASDTSSTYFPEWIYRDLEKGEHGRLIEDEISSEDEQIIKKMTLVSLWCI